MHKIPDQIARAATSQMPPRLTAPARSAEDLHEQPLSIEAQLAAAQFGHNFATISVHSPGKQGSQRSLQLHEAMPRHSAPTTPSALGEKRVIQTKNNMEVDLQGSSSEPRSNKTGLPDNLKAGVENASGFSLDEIRVHYNSPKPAQLQALAYAQGTEIHVAPGEEEHLPHEAWHIVQQAQGRVQPMQIKDGAPVNDDAGLEHEADVMGWRASQMRLETQGVAPSGLARGLTGVAQRETGVIQLRRGKLDGNRVEEGQTVPLDHDAFGGLVDSYKGLHITLLPSKANGNTVHITAYELPNPTAGGPRTYNWFNPETGVWGGWTSGNPLKLPGNEADLKTHVEGIINLFLETEPDVQAPPKAKDFVGLGSKTPTELAREQKEQQRFLQQQAEKAKKKALQEENQKKKQEEIRIAKEKKAAQAKENEERKRLEAEAKAALEEEQRLKKLHEQQLVEYADDIAFGMELAHMYGWSESTVFEMAINHDFRDQVETQNNAGKAPSYIS